MCHDKYLKLYFVDSVLVWSPLSPPPRSVVRCETIKALYNFRSQKIFSGKLINFFKNKCEIMHLQVKFMKATPKTKRVP